MTPEGVQFMMADRSKLIRCVVQSTALRKLAGREIGMDDYEKVFLAFEHEIRLVASRKYDDARALYVPFEITPSDIVRFFPRSERVKPPRARRTESDYVA